MPWKRATNCAKAPRTGAPPGLDPAARTRKDYQAGRSGTKSSLPPRLPGSSGPGCADPVLGHPPIASGTVPVQDGPGTVLEAGERPPVLEREPEEAADAGTTGQ